MSEQMEANVAERILSEGKPTQTVAFPLTGDIEIDFCSAVIMCASSLRLTPAMILRSLEYLKARFGAFELENAQNQKYLLKELERIRKETQGNKYPDGSWPGVYDPQIVGAGLGSSIQIKPPPPKTLMQIFAEEEAKAKSLKNP